MVGPSTALQEEREEEDDDNETDFIALEEKPRSLGNYCSAGHLFENILLKYLFPVPLELGQIPPEFPPLLILLQL